MPCVLDLGRFLSADSVQPNAPDAQGYNLYAYVTNNPTTLRLTQGKPGSDPSGYSVEPLAADQALLNMMYAMRGGLHGIFQCALSEECRDLKALMKKLGSRGANFMVWTAEELQKAFFSTYPHQPTPVDPGLLVLSIGLSNTPILGDLYDLYTGVTGYDPITGQYLAGWERLTNIAGGLLLFPGVTGSNIRHGVHAVESLIDNGDELAQFIGKACSFDEDTPVVTDEGAVPIREIDVGDRVLAWNETVGETGYYTVTAVWAHEDPVTVQLVVNGEVVETTPEHPFYEIESAPWLASGATGGHWTPAGELKAGDQIRQADGTTGVVQTIVFEATPQVMYNLTVADAHTYTVGDGEWVVHNSICHFPTRKILFTQEYFTTSGKIDEKSRYFVVANAQWLIDNPGLELRGGPMGIFLKQPFMDSWGPMKHPEKDYIGDPINLATGFIYTLNNRRLATYILADRQTVPIYWAAFAEIESLRYQFDTTNFGITILPRVR